uniref:SHC SH2 domain-containing protein n=1 Tax=Glossina pallidipes TaxID=7398 RepID=A0A1A9ZX83_GLOPL
MNESINEYELQKKYDEMVGQKCFAPHKHSCPDENVENVSFSISATNEADFNCPLYPLIQLLLWIYTGIDSQIIPVSVFGSIVTSAVCSVLNNTLLEAAAQELLLQLRSNTNRVCELLMNLQITTRAEFKITAVQDDSVHLPEIHDVALEDLWSICLQENSELNFKRTVDALDELRFFYMLIWMPWDNESDDDLSWVEQTLQLRIRLVFDLRQHYLETEVSDNEQDVSVNSVSGKARLEDLLQSRLRLSTIRTELEILENPDLGHIYQEMRTMLITLNATPSIEKFV